jgi:hypothetical protein
LKMKISSVEASFILGFGIFHFAIPFILPPNFNATDLFGLQIADFVLPGCFALAISAIAFYLTKSRYPAVLLAFFYCGGIIFHALYLSGLFPPVIIVPSNMLLVVGIVVDALSVAAICDFYRRFKW